MNDTQQQNQSPVAPNQQTPAQPVPPAQTPLPPPSTMSESPKPRSGLPKSPFLYALITFLLGICVGYLLISQFPGKNTTQSSTETKQTKITLSLPDAAIDLKTCIDKKGNLFADPKALPQGPIFLVDQQNVVGIEYVLNQEEFENKKVYEDLAAFNISINHVQVATLSANYEGKTGDFYSVNLFTVDKKTIDAVKCPAPIPTIVEASPSAAVSTIPQASSIPSAIPSTVPSLIISPSAAVLQ